MTYPVIKQVMIDAHNITEVIRQPGEIYSIEFFEHVGWVVYDHQMEEYNWKFDTKEEAVSFCSETTTPEFY